MLSSTTSDVGHDSIFSRTFLGLSEPGPKLSPSGETLARRKEILHLSAYQLTVISIYTFSGVAPL
jgi:hypothetical protein